MLEQLIADRGLSARPSACGSLYSLVNVMDLDIALHVVLDWRKCHGAEDI